MNTRLFINQVAAGIADFGVSGFGLDPQGAAFNDSGRGPKNRAPTLRPCRTWPSALGISPLTPC